MTPPLLLPPRSSTAHKGTFGRVLLVGGSRGMAGSIALSSMAALHCGSGLVAAAVPDAILETVASFHPAIMTIGLDDSDGTFDRHSIGGLLGHLSKQAAIGVGPGMTTSAGATAVLDGLLSRARCPLVLDADAINVMAQQQWLDSATHLRRDLVLTPHAGELARLTGVPASAPESQWDAAVELARSRRITLVIKGGPSRVVATDAEGRLQTWTNTTGNPGMATAGCGDVLTGVITSLLGQGLSPWDAARLGVWVHGLAGDEAAEQTSQIGMTAMHLLAALPGAAGSISDPT
ncbi:MAG: NAD(P)H-hydrate dehydratase [Planctomycetota bacterium]